MRKRLISLLVCPICKGQLNYQSATQEMICRTDKIAFPVRNGVPVLLEMDARRLDAVSMDQVTNNESGL